MNQKKPQTTQVEPSFSLSVDGGHTTEELVELGSYDFSNDWINSKNFPMRQKVQEEVQIELIKLDRNPTSDEALEEAKSRGLERPTYEQALFFGAQCHEEQRKAPVVFLHEPVRGPSGDPSVLGLWSDGARRRLSLSWFGGGWNSDCRFAFVRPKQ